MSKLFDKYMTKAKEVNENWLQPNQVEIQKDNVFGSIGGKDLSKLSATELYALIKEHMPKLYEAIEKVGGLEKLKGSTDRVADIKAFGKDKYEVTPDA